MSRLLLGIYCVLLGMVVKTIMIGLAYPEVNVHFPSAFGIAAAIVMTIVVTEYKGRA
jgi:hypothetical protein